MATGNHTYIDSTGIKLKNGDLILGKFANNSVTIGNQVGTHLEIKLNQIKLKNSISENLIIGKYGYEGTALYPNNGLISKNRNLIISNEYDDTKLQGRKAYIEIKASNSNRYEQADTASCLKLGTNFSATVEYKDNYGNKGTVDRNGGTAITITSKINAKYNSDGTFSDADGGNLPPDIKNVIDIGSNDSFNQININGKIIDSNGNSVIGSRILYNGGATGGTVPLSESASNFNYIEIYFCNTVYDDSNSSHTAYDMTKVYSPNGKYVLLFTGYYPALGVNMQIIERLVLISGTSITQTSCRYSNLNPGVSGGTVNDYNKIYKVVGYK